ncbi:MAG: Gfo/Idh/MocA family oxidoreductase [Kordiimonadaceae bacterium]|nr:Gfo/Idh/MocA family oxidoreductase [Kordiimonadaceae bacterium]MBT6032821.1 Gfo/Idh/MocA family oxidoreductase [Kordiimonadaceae bacterium]MBT6330124.1 Gfo/Idh/MocA family oxidoreductase [Kordiimonadaceae bacterium]
MGMVGGGPGSFIGEVHRMAARLDNQIELVCGSFSSDFEKSKQTGSDLFLDPARVYEDYNQMMEKEAALPIGERMDFVAIVTPNHLHLPPAEAALRAGFHVMSDKPATLNLDEAKKLQDIVDETGLLYGLTHTYLGYPMVKQARAMVKDGKLGEIRKILVEYPQGWLSQDVDNKQAEWRMDPAKSGVAGAMGDIGTHAHNLAEYISGDIMVDVCADLNIYVKGRLLDDDGSVLFRMQNGASGTLTASQICAGEENALKIKIYGEKGGLEWHQMEPFNLYYKPHGAAMQTYTAGLDKSNLSAEAYSACRLPSGHPEGYLEAFANLYTGFAEAIRAFEGDYMGHGLIGIEEGVRGMAFVEALVKSTNSNEKWIKIEN